MASATTATRGAMFMSNRPTPETRAGSFVARSTVSCSRASVGTGFTASVTTSGSPVLIPPSTPPERLLPGRAPPGAGTMASFASEPFIRAWRIARPEGDRLDAADREERLPEPGRKFPEHRRAEPRRQALRRDRDDAARGVALRRDRADRGPRPLEVLRGADLDAGHLEDRGADGDAGGRRELPRHRAGGEARHALPPRRPPAAPRIDVA